MLSGVAIAMLMFGVIVLYVFGLGWGIYRALKKSKETEQSS